VSAIISDISDRRNKTEAVMKAVIEVDAAVRE